MFFSSELSEEQRERFAGLPSREVLTEYRRRLTEIRAAIKRGEDITEMGRSLKQFMVKNGLGNEAPIDDAPSSAPPTQSS